MKKQRAVLSTGCSSGIGLNVAHGLQAAGFLSIASARKPEDVERLRAAGLPTVQLDLDDPQSIRTGLQAALEISGGTLYGLFNNGAYGQPGAVEDLSWEALEAQLRTNLLGWHELTRLVIPLMREAGAGRIIHNSSILGLIALPYRGAYACSKFALEGLTDTLRLELSGSGIQISLIEPGPIRSRFRDNAHRMYQKNIDVQNSVHRAKYQAMEARLLKEGDAAPFTLPPEAVLEKVLHALNSPRAKLRYPVTKPAYLFSLLRRILSSRQLDWVMLKVSRNGSR